MQSNSNTQSEFSLYMHEPFPHNGPRTNLYQEIIKDYQDRDNQTKWVEQNYKSITTDKDCNIENYITEYEKNQYILGPKECFSLGYLYTKLEKVDENVVLKNFIRLEKISEDPIVHYYISKKYYSIDMSEPYGYDYKKIEEHISLAKVDPNYSSEMSLQLHLANVYYYDKNNIDYSERLNKAISIYERYIDKYDSSQLNDIYPKLANAYFSNKNYDKAKNLSQYLTWQRSFYETDLNKALEICNKYLKSIIGNINYESLFVQHYLDLLKKANQSTNQSTNENKTFYIDYCRQFVKYLENCSNTSCLQVEVYSLIPDFSEIANIYYTQFGYQKVIGTKILEKAFENKEDKAYYYQALFTKDFKDIKTGIEYLAEKNYDDLVCKLLHLYFDLISTEEEFQFLLSIYEKYNNLNRARFFFYNSFLIGKSYFEGIGVQKDFDKAYEYLKISENDSYYNWKDLKRMMKVCEPKNYLTLELQDFIDDEKDKLSNGTYLSICNILKSLYEKEKKWSRKNEESVFDSEYDEFEEYIE